MSRLLQIPRAIKLLALCLLSLVLGLLVFVKLSLHIWQIGPDDSRTSGSRPSPSPLDLIALEQKRQTL